MNTFHVLVLLSSVVLLQSHILICALVDINLK